MSSLHFICLGFNSCLDSGDNGRVEYTWTEVTFGSSNYFHMSARGQVVLTVNAKDYMTYGDVHRFIVTATDKGTPPLSSTAVLDIMYRVCNTRKNHILFIFSTNRYSRLWNKFLQAMLITPVTSFLMEPIATRVSAKTKLLLPLCWARQGGAY